MQKIHFSEVAFLFGKTVRHLIVDQMSFEKNLTLPWIRAGKMGTLRLPYYRNDAKIGKIYNLWTFWPVIHLLKI